MAELGRGESFVRKVETPCNHQNLISPLAVTTRLRSARETVSQSQPAPHPSRRPALRLRHFRPLANRIRVRMSLLLLESVTGGGAELSAFSLPGVTKL